MNAKVWVKWREYIQGKKKQTEILIFEKLKTKMFGFLFFCFLPEMINYLNPAT